MNFYILLCADAVICFDCGFGKSSILQQLKTLRIDPEKATHLFLTHSDFDHTGGVALFTNAKMYLSADEEPMVARKKARMFGVYYNGKLNAPCHYLKDNEVVTAGSAAIRALATPGHTPGSMSYLVNESILFCGDTFKLVNGKIVPLRRYINMDTEQQIESIRKLAKLDNVRLALTGHSGFTEEFSQAIKDWKQAAGTIEA